MFERVTLYVIQKNKKHPALFANFALQQTNKRLLAVIKAKDGSTKY